MTTANPRVRSSPARAGLAGSTAGPRRPSSLSRRTKSNAETATSGDDVRRYAAEFIGTALLVLVGVGVAVLAPGAGPIGVALAFGLILTVLVFAIGPISGCHLNPAVTLGMLLAKRLPPRRALLYVVAQIAGGIAGTAVVLTVANNRTGYLQSRDGLGANGWGAHSSGGYGAAAAAIVEVVLTAVLVFTVLRVTADSDTAKLAGLPIGLALLVAHLLAVPIDGTSVNPARSIGPALLHGGAALSQLWLFIIAPLAGAVLAVGALKLFTLKSDDAATDRDHGSPNPGRAAPHAPAANRKVVTESTEHAVADDSSGQHPANDSAPRPRKRKPRRKRR